MALELLNVVHQAVHRPLSIHLASTSKRESTESLGIANIAEPRLDEAEASTVLVSTDVAVDLALHLVERLLWLPRHKPAEEYDLSIGRTIGMTQALQTQRASPARAAAARELGANSAIDHYIRPIAM